MNLPPSPSAPFRFASLTSTARWQRGEGNQNNTNRVPEVPNLFQDLTGFTHEREGAELGSGTVFLFHNELSVAGRVGHLLSRGKKRSEKVNPGFGADLAAHPPPVPPGAGPSQVQPSLQDKTIEQELRNRHVDHVTGDQA